MLLFIQSTNRYQGTFYHSNQDKKPGIPILIELAQISHAKYFVNKIAKTFIILLEIFLFSKSLMERAALIRESNVKT